LGAASAGGLVREALAAAQDDDLALLRFALTLEYVEAAFYRHATRLPLSPRAADLARQLARQEQDHVDALAALIRRLGGRPPGRPPLTFPDRDEKGFLVLAQTLEETGVGAYGGLAVRLESRLAVAAVASIVQVEARHAAAIRLARGFAPAPAAFDKPLGRQQALEAIAPLRGP
jgi:rubrerythrin